MVVEQKIASVNETVVMTFNHISSAKAEGDTLDCGLALDNLKQLLKLYPNFDLPPRKHAVPGEHIFKPLVPEEAVDLKIPADPPNLGAAELKHVAGFIGFLPSAVPAIKRAIEIAGENGVFLPTVGRRGQALYDGAYVLQLRVQKELLSVWTVKYLVGASYSYETHWGYFQISQDDAAKEHICDCFSGYVFCSHFMRFLPLNACLFIFLIFFCRAKTCSHFFAVLLLLRDFADANVPTQLVCHVL